MRPAMALVLCTFLFCRWGIAQDLKNDTVPSKASVGGSKVYVVQLTEFRMKRSANAHLTASEIVKAFEDSKDDGEVEIIETIRLSALDGQESMMQIGKRVTVTTGVTNSPGGVKTRQLMQQNIGTIVSATVASLEGKIQLKLNYESSRLEGPATEDVQQDVNTCVFKSALLLEPAKTVLVGGTSSDASTWLVVSIK